MNACNSKPRVLHMLTNLNLGGAQLSVTNICSGLSTRGYDMHLAFSSFGGRAGLQNTDLLQKLHDNEVKIHDITQMVHALHPVHDLRALIHMRRLMRKIRPDIVHTHMSKAGILGRLAATLEGVPCIIHGVRSWSFYSTNSSFKKWVYVLLERCAALHSNALWAVSKQLLRDGLSHHIGTPNTYKIVRSGIEIAKFENAPSKSATTLGITKSWPIVGTVMGITPAKAPADFIQVCARVAKAFPCVTFLVIGDGPERSVMESLAKKEGIAHQLHITGLRSDVPALLPLIDVFLLTSHWEGLPRVVMEAAAAQIPIVSTSVGGVPEIVHHRVSGLLAPPRDISTLTKHVLTLLQNPEKGKKMATLAKQTLEQEFDLDFVIHRHKKLYEQLLSGKKGSDKNKLSC